MVFQIAVAVVLLIYWGVSAAGLRQACKECGESEPSIARIVGIGFAHCAGVISFCFVVGGLGIISLIISVLVGVVIVAVLVRFILPTSTGQAVTIAICHFHMTTPVMTVVLIGFVATVMMIAASRA